jgi:hypothetical protein
VSAYQIDYSYGNGLGCLRLRVARWTNTDIKKLLYSSMVRISNSFSGCTLTQLGQKIGPQTPFDQHLSALAFLYISWMKEYSCSYPLHSRARRSGLRGRNIFDINFLANLLLALQQMCNMSNIQKFSQTLMPFSGKPSVGMQSGGMAGRGSAKVQKWFCNLC